MSREFLIQPNCSLSDQGRRYFLWSMGLMMLMISVGMAILGLWLIAPFMGLEWLILRYVFNKVGKQCHRSERVIIQDEKLSIVYSTTESHNTHSFSLYWVNIELRQPKNRWYNSQLLIGTHGSWVELATFLNNEERASLAVALKAAILTERQS